ncbi:MAG: YqgE/AlgH family protein [Desulfobulbaceae bacterium]|nr:YqgE/AlgH family protein [Desulfobulbaceae bacterium]
MESLKGHFLIATAQMPDPRFHGQVVYICAHTEEGAMGLVVNHPIPDLTLADILHGANLPTPAGTLPPVYMGGPVELETAFFLHSADYQPKTCLEVSSTVRLSREPAILRDIVSGRGPQRYIFLLGYAGWAPGQLEHELTVNGWLTVPGSDAILFETPDDLKWKEAAMSYGIDISLYGDIIGSA